MLGEEQHPTRVFHGAHLGHGCGALTRRDSSADSAPLFKIGVRLCNS